MSVHVPVPEHTLRRVAQLFHEIVTAFTAEDLLGNARNANARNAKLMDTLRANSRSREELKQIAVEGFELCVSALVTMGASDVMIRKCGASSLGEAYWSGGENVD